MIHSGERDPNNLCSVVAFTILCALLARRQAAVPDVCGDDVEDGGGIVNIPAFTSHSAESMQQVAHYLIL